MTIAADALHNSTLALTTALATLTADGASPTSAHVSSAVSSFVIYQTALSVPNISTQASSIVASGLGAGGSAYALISTHLAAVSRLDGGVQVNLKADLSTVLAAMA